jgi:hypothetical protein
MYRDFPAAGYVLTDWHEIAARLRLRADCR